MNRFTLAISILGAVYGLWFVAIGVLGSLRKLPKPLRAGRELRFAVVIPARNEAAVVGHLVRSLMNQSYPREKFDVFVIPNGCADNTEGVALAAGAKVIPCHVKTRSKGDVLRFAFSEIPKIGAYDAYAILDADNLAAPGFLRAANDNLCAGFEICQGHRDSKNPADSWVAGSTSIFFWIMNRFYNRPRGALGMSAALNGTGIILRASLVERLGWNVRTLTEDLEYSAVCAQNGVKIGYAADAVIYDEQPLGLRDSMVQRRRWFSGGMQCFRALGWGLIRKGSLHAVDMLFVFSGWIMQILTLIPGVYSVYTIVRAIYAGEMRIESALVFGAALLALAYLGGVLTALAVLRLEGKLARRMTPTILLFPLFLLSWVPANLWAIVTPPPKWVQIAHVRSVDAPE